MPDRHDLLRVQQLPRTPPHNIVGCQKSSKDDSDIKRFVASDIVLSSRVDKIGSGGNTMGIGMQRERNFGTDISRVGSSNWATRCLISLIWTRRHRRESQQKWASRMGISKVYSPS